MLSELKSYVRSKGAYQAQRGSTDDCISASLIITRIVEEIATYEQSAFDKLYGEKTEDWSTTGEWGEDEYDGSEEPLPMAF